MCFAQFFFCFVSPLKPVDKTCTLSQDNWKEKKSGEEKFPNISVVIKETL